MISTLRIILLLGLVMLAAGCASTTGSRFALKPTDHFLQLASEPRVLYEPGAEAFAIKVAEKLPQAIIQVETGHFRAFQHDIQIYVCGTDTCFSNYVTTPKVSAAVVPNNRLFLSPRLFTTEIQRLPSILTHELSHLHLGQQVGHFTYTIPVWFHEGLAAQVSNGGGADYASEEQALKAFQTGRHFTPEARDDVHSRKRADYWGLSPFLFYRQSMMFVEFIKQLAETKFQQFLLAVQNNEDFDLAFSNAYNMDMATADRHFLQRMQAAPFSQVSGIATNLP